MGFCNTKGGLGNGEITIYRHTSLNKNKNNMKKYIKIYKEESGRRLKERQKHKVRLRVWDKESKAVWPDPLQILSGVKSIHCEITGRAVQTQPTGGCWDSFRFADRETLVDFYCVTSAFEAWLSTFYLLQNGHQIKAGQPRPSFWLTC